MLPQQQIQVRMPLAYNNLCLIAEIGGYVGGTARSEYEHAGLLVGLEQDGGDEVRSSISTR